LVEILEEILGEFVHYTDSPLKTMEYSLFIDSLVEIEESRSGVDLRLAPSHKDEGIEENLFFLPEFEVIDRELRITTEVEMPTTVELYEELSTTEEYSFSSGTVIEMPTTVALYKELEALEADTSTATCLVQKYPPITEEISCDPYRRDNSPQLIAVKKLSRIARFPKGAGMRRKRSFFNNPLRGT